MAKKKNETSFFYKAEPVKLTYRPSKYDPRGVPDKVVADEKGGPVIKRYIENVVDSFWVMSSPDKKVAINSTNIAVVTQKFEEARIRTNIVLSLKGDVQMLRQELNAIKNGSYRTFFYFDVSLGSPPFLLHLTDRGAFLFKPPIPVSSNSFILEFWLPFPEVSYTEDSKSHVIGVGPNP